MSNHNRLCAIGDSYISHGVSTFAPTQITSEGIIATVTSTGHGLWRGARISVERADQDEYNGLYTVDDVIDANVFTFRFSGSATRSASSVAGFIVGAQQKQTDRCFAAWANALFSGGPRFVLDTVAGAGGETSGQVRSRFVRDCLSRQPRLVLEYSGINDIIYDVPINTIFENRKSMWDAAIQSGARPIVTTLAPLAPGHGSYSQTRLTNIIMLNARIRDYARSNGAAILLDVFKVVVDPTSNYSALAGGTYTSSFEWKSGYESDNIHPLSKAHLAIGAELASVLSAVLPPMNLLPSSVADSYQYSSGSSQLLDNPLMQTGAAGSTAGTVTGTVAELWQITESGSASVSASVVARADGIGNNQRMVTTSTAANDYAELHQPSSIHGRVSEGDRLVAICEVSLSAVTALGRLTYSVEFTVDGVTYTAGFVQSDTTMDTDNRTFVLATPEITIPPGLLSNLRTRLRVRHTGAGGSTCDIGRCGLYKLN